MIRLMPIGHLPALHETVSFVAVSSNNNTKENSYREKAILQSHGETTACGRKCAAPDCKVVLRRAKRWQAVVEHRLRVTRGE
jgi:hypothetical protein